MSEENVEIVRRMFQAFRNRDWTAAREPVDPEEIEMDVTRSPIEGLSGVYRGREEVAYFWSQWLEAWGEQEIEEEELIDAGDQVVTWTASHKFRGRGSGVTVDFPPYAWLVTLRDGKVVRGTLYMDKGEALKAAGLSE
ncbi:MAG: nuclear transport factor 2 family protein [Solirubrobacterales bacterium]